MDIRSAQLFLHLASSLNFSKTSEQLYVSPSTLTRIIQRLEDDLGVQLFSRDNRSVRLTPAGVRFQQFVKKYLEDWHQLQVDLALTSTSCKANCGCFGPSPPAIAICRLFWINSACYAQKLKFSLTTGDAAWRSEKVQKR